MGGRKNGLQGCHKDLSSGIPASLGSPNHLVSRLLLNWDLRYLSASE